METKTDKLLLLLQHLKDTPRSMLSEEEVKKILGNPPRASFYRLLSCLLQERGSLRPLVVKIRKDDKTFYALNRKDWKQYAELDNETNFILHCLRNADQNFSRLAEELGIFEGSDLQGMEHQFIHMEDRGEVLSCEQTEYLQLIIRSLLAKKKILVTLEKKTFDFVPLTLCQFKGSLYLLGAKDEFKDGQITSLKLQDLQKVTETSNSFTYPSPARYSPKAAYARLERELQNDEDLLSYHFLNVEEEIPSNPLNQDLREKLLKKAELILEKYGDFSAEKVS